MKYDPGFSIYFMISPIRCSTGCYNEVPRTLGLIWMTGAHKTKQNQIFCCKKNGIFFSWSGNCLYVFIQQTLPSWISASHLMISFCLLRDAQVPRPRIRVGFIPGGSTDSVSDPGVMVVATVILMLEDDPDADDCRWRCVSMEVPIPWQLLFTSSLETICR